VFPAFNLPTKRQKPKLTYFFLEEFFSPTFQSYRLTPWPLVLSYSTLKSDNLRQVTCSTLKKIIWWTVAKYNQCSNVLYLESYNSIGFRFGIINYSDFAHFPVIKIKITNALVTGSVPDQSQKSKGNVYAFGPNRKSYAQPQVQGFRTDLLSDSKA